MIVKVTQKITFLILFALWGAQLGCALFYHPKGEWSKSSLPPLHRESLKNINLEVICKQENASFFSKTSTRRLCDFFKKHLESYGAQITEKDPQALKVNFVILPNEAQYCNFFLTYISLGLIPCINTETSQMHLKIQNPDGILLSDLPIAIEERSYVGWISLYMQTYSESKEFREPLVKAFLNTVVSEVYTQSLRFRTSPGLPL